jgi:hypothetical protein
MRIFLFFLLLTISTACFSQQFVRGYTAGFAYGFLSDGDNLTVTYEGQDFSASVRKATSSTYSVGFPIDYGYSRHRWMIVPGVDLTTGNYHLSVEGQFPGMESDTDSTKVRTSLLMPQAGLHYKFHFYVGPLHFALSAGMNIKFPISFEYNLADKNNADLSSFTELRFAEGSILKNLESLEMQMSPQVGLDVYVSKFWVLNLYTYISPLSSKSNSQILRGFYGAGVTYLVPFGKEDETRVLQYYKNK